MGDKRNFAAFDWVIGEIGESLSEARKALEAYVEDPKDSARMRFCLTYIHQVHGSLHMVEFYGASLLAEEMEHLAHALINQNVSNMNEAQEVLMRSLLQLPIYLDHVKAHRNDHPGVVLPLLNDLRAVRKQSYLSETNLFSPDLSVTKRTTGAIHQLLKDRANLMQVLKKLREMYQFAAASVLRGIKLEENLVHLDKVCSRMELITQATPCYPLWEVSSALMDGLRRDDIELSVAVRGLLRYLAREMRILGEHGLAAFKVLPRESLLKNLLFYVARADSQSEKISAVQRRYKLDRALLYGSSDNALDESAFKADHEAVRSVVLALKDELNNVKSIVDLSLSGQGSHDDLKDILPIFKRLGDTLAILGIGDLRKQVLAQGDMIKALCDEQDFDDARLMHIAGKIVEVDHRLDAIAKSAGKVANLENLDEREIEIDEAKLAVIKECTLGLEQAKEAISEYINSDWLISHLESVGTLLTNIRGGLEIIPLHRAAGVLDACGRYIEEELIQKDVEPEPAHLDKLADAIASVEYYLERLIKDLDYDPGPLLDVAESSVSELGYSSQARQKTPASESPLKEEPHVALANESDSGGDQPQATSRLGSPSSTESVSNEGGVSTEQENSQASSLLDSSVTENQDVSAESFTSAPLESAAQSVGEKSTDNTRAGIAQESESGKAQSQEASDALHNSTQGTPAPQKHDATPADITSAEDDPDLEDVDEEIVEIFIEEAEEVLETLAEYFPKWRNDNDDQDSLVVVRRAFHTLKGSGRMVQAMDIGDLAWSIENMLNRVIDGSIVVGDPHLTLIDDSRSLFPTLVEAFKQRKVNPEKQRTQAFIDYAEALSKGEAPDAPWGAQTAEIDDTDDNDDLILWEIFSSESRSHLETIDHFVREMEADAPDYSPPTNDLQRALHTLKGSAKMAQVEPVAKISESLESFAKELITYQVSIDDDILQLIKDAADYTRSALSSGLIGKAVDVPKLEQFLARSVELRERSVGHLIRLKEMEKDGQNQVDPRLLSIFMAEDMKLLLDADKILRDWHQEPSEQEKIPKVMTELSTLSEGARLANLPDMSRLSSMLHRIHEQALAGQQALDDDLFAILLDGHEALLDMVDAVAAGQTFESTPEVILSALESLIFYGDKVEPQTLETQETPADIPLERDEPVADLTASEHEAPTTDGDTPTGESDVNEVAEYAGEDKLAADTLRPEDAQSTANVIPFAGGYQGADSSAGDADTLAESQEDSAFQSNAPTQTDESLPGLSEVERDVDDDVPTLMEPIHLAEDESFTVAEDESFTADLQDDDLNDAETALGVPTNEQASGVSENEGSQASIGSPFDQEEPLQLDDDHADTVVLNAEPLTPENLGVDSAEDDHFGQEEASLPPLVDLDEDEDQTIIIDVESGAVSDIVSAETLSAFASGEAAPDEVTRNNEVTHNNDVTPNETTSNDVAELLDEAIDEPETLGAYLNTPAADLDEAPVVEVDDATISPESDEFVFNLSDEKLADETEEEISAADSEASPIYLTDIPLTGPVSTSDDEPIVISEETVDAESEVVSLSSAFNDTGDELAEDIELSAQTLLGGNDLDEESEVASREKIPEDTLSDTLSGLDHYTASLQSAAETGDASDSTEEKRVEVEGVTDIESASEVFENTSHDDSIFETETAKDVESTVAEFDQHEESVQEQTAETDSFVFEPLQESASDNRETPEDADRVESEDILVGDEVPTFEDLAANDLQEFSDTPVSTEIQDTPPAALPTAAVASMAYEGLIDVIDFDDEDFDEDIIDIFLEEADELMEELEEASHTWESDWGDQDSVEEMKRVLHTLKGGARLAGMNNLGELTHDFESVVIGQKTAELSEGFFSQLHGFQDRILRAVKATRLYVDDRGAKLSEPEVSLAAEPAVQDPLTDEPTLGDGSTADRGEISAQDASEGETNEGLSSEEEIMEETASEGAFFKTDVSSDNDSVADDISFVVPLAPNDGDSSNVVPFSPKTREEEASEPLEPSHDDTGFTLPLAPRPSGGASSGGGGAMAQTTATSAVATKKIAQQEMIKVSAELIEELVNLAGETSISRARLEQQVSDFSGSLDEVDATLNRLQEQLRRLDIETEAQILFRQEQMADHEEFDPLEMDRYSQLQQLSRSLIESASDLVDLKTTLGEKVRDTETILLQQARINSNLQEGLMRSRMVPFSRLVPRLRRIVRQVAAELEKNVTFELDNIEGELDRSVLERMVAPLEHMLRNAVDHGIESPRDRIEAEKNESGRIILSLGREGGDVILRLADDGRGIDLKRVREKAIERELMSEDAQLSDNEVMQFILHAGFSTAESVTQISGRGVGMDVVASEIKQLGGTVKIDSQWGKGTEIIVRLPFTVSVNRALMVSLGNDLYAVPLNSIEGIVRVSPFELEHYYSHADARFEYAGEHYHVRYLGGLLSQTMRPKLEGPALPLPVLLVRSAEHAMALQVDALLGSREVVVKSLGQQFSSVVALSGATVMGDGSVVVILDPHALVRQEIALATQYVPILEQSGNDDVDIVDETKTIMVVDDSVTVRKVTTRFLEREGFNVITAKDGVDALRLLQETIPDMMLLDIEMPRMDGFEVAKNIRNTRRWKHIPIIMITSRTGDKHREHALSLGVSKYLGKPYQEDILLESMYELLIEKKQR